MSRTTYSPLTATRTTTDGGFVVSSTMVLEPQTTPFVQPSGCSPSVYCNQGSMAPSGWCVEIDTMWEADFNIVSSPCYPPEYTNIYLYQGDGADLTTAAFPGDACISGWTTACSGTIVGEDSSTYAQTFCCPPGDYTCDMQYTRRECVRMLSTSTEIWVDNTTATYGFETTQFPGFDNGEEPIWVWRRAFPLTGAPVAQVTDASDSGIVLPSGFATADGKPAETGGSNSSSSDMGPLSTSGIVGVAIGAVALISLFVGLGIWMGKRRRPAQPAESPKYDSAAIGTGFATPQSQQSRSQDFGEEKELTAYAGYYSYSKPELASQGAEVSELAANYGPGHSPVELDAQDDRQFPLTQKPS